MSTVRRGISMPNSTCSMALVLCAAFAGGSVNAREAPLEASHRGVQLIAWSAKPGDYYEVGVIAADQAIERIRTALDLIEEQSSFGTAALEKLKKGGDVTIVYEPSFPHGPASSAGTVLAAFVPDLIGGDFPGVKNYPIIVGRYIVKWTTDGLASTLVHELVHGIQHMDGRLGSLGKLDMECEASLYQESALQDFSVDKRSEQVVGLRRTLQLRSCVPFIQYMKANTPSKMGLWNTLNPDVPQLLSIFDEYLQTD